MNTTDAKRVLETARRGRDQLLALDAPERCLLRGDAWIFGPEAQYETHGDVSHVVFPCGISVGADNDRLLRYYGAADTSIAVAQGSVRAILRWLDVHGHPDCGGRTGESRTDLEDLEPAP